MGGVGILQIILIVLSSAGVRQCGEQAKPGLPPIDDQGRPFHWAALRLGFGLLLGFELLDLSGILPGYLGECLGMMAAFANTVADIGPVPAQAGAVRGGHTVIKLLSAAEDQGQGLELLRLWHSDHIRLGNGRLSGHDLNQSLGEAYLEFSLGLLWLGHPSGLLLQPLGFLQSRSGKQAGRCLYSLGFCPHLFDYPGGFPSQGLLLDG